MTLVRLLGAMLDVVAAALPHLPLVIILLAYAVAHRRGDLRDSDGPLLPLRPLPPHALRPRGEP